MATELTGGDKARDQAPLSAKKPSEFRYREMKLIDKLSRYAVYGYIRRHQALLAARIIPELVHFTILMFYRAKNQWNESDCDSQWIQLSNKNLTVTHKYDKETNHVLRAEQGYVRGTHVWKNKMDHFQASFCNFLGVASLDAPESCSWYHSEKNQHFWGFRLHSLHQNDPIINGTPQLVHEDAIYGNSSCKRRA